MCWASVRLWRSIARVWPGGQLRWCYPQAVTPCANRNGAGVTYVGKEKKMGKRKRRGKLNWRSKKANKGRKPTLG
jgi:hypothetical protein